VLSKQIEMRQVLFCKEDFTRLTSVLDFGCGHGTDVIQIAAQFPHLQVHGCTITRDQAILGNRRISSRALDHDKVRIHHQDSSKGPLPGRYDLIFGIEVSFHIRDKVALFDNIRRSLTEHGRVLLIDYISNLAGSVDDPNVEISIPTAKEWATLTSQHGLEIDEIIDVSAEIANFLYDPQVEDHLGDLPEVTRRTLKNYANQSASLDRRWISYVLIKLQRRDGRDRAELESHNLAAIQAPTPYSTALKAMRHVQYPSRAAAPAETAGVSFEKLQQRVRAMVAEVLGLETSIVDVDQAFSELGLDSFLGTELIIAVNKEFGTALSNVQVFNYPTVRALAQFLEQELEKRPAAPAPVVSTVRAPLPRSNARLTLKRRTGIAPAATSPRAPSDDRIAIIGMSGRYPQANNLDEYWANLAAGRDSIVEVPPQRWTGKRGSKWLGAMDDIECFDPLFFRISPHEAELIDPQQRLFLQEAYKAFENAGYSGRRLSNTKCGVYLGISTNEYALLLSRNAGLQHAPVTSNSSAIAAARIAYYLNLKGAAISIDTACSSSLVAIHLACQGLSSGETDMALAGGVTIWLTPESYASMSEAGMFAADGRCKTFDDAADGIVVGDGVGVLVLKRLKDAQRDNDQIYGVILGSGINQDGKTNGITAPSVKSQIELERSIYEKYGIDPETISYVEAHGTGTKLGDPIELEALATVFQEKTNKKNFCGLGSVKSNIGHTTAAAGVAGVQKVLLSMRHRTLVPTLHVTRETSHFDFENSPFYVSRETKSWDVPPGSLRRAAVSSFGFSGTNAHLVIEEYPAPAETTAPLSANTPVLVPLSARTAEALRQRSRDLLEFIRTARQPIDPTALAYTLQTGREAMEERLGIVVSSVDELQEKLGAFLRGENDVAGLRRGRVETDGEGVTIIGRDDDMQEAIEKWIARRKLAPLLDLWIRGLDFDFDRLHGDVKPRRIALPTYPFARTRCWVDETPADSMDVPITCEEQMKSIEEIIDQIAGNTIDTGEAVHALRALV